jgi:hypothetical protein
VCPQALPAASQPDSRAGPQALEDEWVLLRALPGPRVLPPVAPLLEQRQALWEQPAQPPERLPLEPPASQSGLPA